MSPSSRFLNNVSRQVKTDLNRFRRDDDGGLIIFSLLVLISMLVLGGMAVDFMRQENNRIVLQGVADRSVLSAASLQQTINGQELVEDYFLKSGLSTNVVGTPFFDDGGNSKRVSVTATRDIDTFFLRLIGIDTLSSTATANAIESTGKVEISLVIDVTASMRSGGSGGRIQDNAESIANDGRIGDLRVAAKEFATTVLDPVYEGQVSLNIIPYGGHTNPGPEMAAMLGATGRDDIAMEGLPYDAILPGREEHLFEIREYGGEHVLVMLETDIKSISTFELDPADGDIEEQIANGIIVPQPLYYSGRNASNRIPILDDDGVPVLNTDITRMMVVEKDLDGSPVIDAETLEERLIEFSYPSPVPAYKDWDDALLINGTTVFLDAGTTGIPEAVYAPPSSCIEIEGANDWTSHGPPAMNQPLLPNYMVYGFSKWEIDKGVRNWGWCPQDETVIKYAMQDASEAEDYINGLSLYDGTGTDMAMKWGLATLSPDMQPYFQRLHDDHGLVPADFVNRPAAFDDVETRKIIVLMTDGQVTGQIRPNNADNIRNLLDVTPNDRTNDRDWQGWIIGHNNSDGRDTSPKSANTARTDLVRICTLAKANDITVYTVAFEYPTDGSFANNVTAMKNCATPGFPDLPGEPQYYFETSGVGLSSVFNEIAQQISELRLTD